jgi:hypothetical protein
MGGSPGSFQNPDFKILTSWPFSAAIKAFAQPEFPAPTIVIIIPFSPFFSLKVFD